MYAQVGARNLKQTLGGIPGNRGICLRVGTCICKEDKIIPGHYRMDNRSMIAGRKRSMLMLEGSRYRNLAYPSPRLVAYQYLPFPHQSRSLKIDAEQMTVVLALNKKLSCERGLKVCTFSI
ncbi:hypothetical protein HZ326_25579 [Fusarium oxysporum f. sp. albedinis]|nr:hypothetical protein HZ326_25579 [Fusarium oxysporum f. sp. albedinis]